MGAIDSMICKQINSRQDTQNSVLSVKKGEKMLVEMYEIGGLWYFRDENNAEWSTGLPSGVKPMEALVPDNKDNIKAVRKLKEAGFTADEIVDMFNAGIVL